MLLHGDIPVVIISNDYEDYEPNVHVVDYVENMECVGIGVRFVMINDPTKLRVSVYAKRKDDTE